MATIDYNSGNINVSFFKTNASAVWFCEKNTGGINIATNGAPILSNTLQLGNLNTTTNISGNVKMNTLTPIRTTDNLTIGTSTSSTIFNVSVAKIVFGNSPFGNSPQGPALTYTFNKKNGYSPTKIPLNIYSISGNPRGASTLYEIILSGILDKPFVLKYLFTIKSDILSTIGELKVLDKTLVYSSVDSYAGWVTDYVLDFVQNQNTVTVLFTPSFGVSYSFTSTLIGYPSSSAYSEPTSSIYNPQFVSGLTVTAL